MNVWNPKLLLILLLITTSTKGLTQISAQLNQNNQNYVFEQIHFTVSDNILASSSGLILLDEMRFVDTRGYLSYVFDGGYYLLLDTLQQVGTLHYPSSSNFRRFHFVLKPEIKPDVELIRGRDGGVNWIWLEDNNCLEIYDIKNHQTIIHEDILTRSALHADGYVAYAQDELLYLLDLNTQKQTSYEPFSKRPPINIQFSDSGRFLVVSDFKQTFVASFQTGNITLKNVVDAPYYLIAPADKLILVDAIKIDTNYYGKKRDIIAFDYEVNSLQSYDIRSQQIIEMDRVLLDGQLKHDKMDIFRSLRKELGAGISIQPTGPLFSVGEGMGCCTVYSIEKADLNQLGFKGGNQDSMTVASTSLELVSGRFYANGKLYLTSTLSGRVDLYHIDDEHRLNRIDFSGQIFDISADGKFMIAQSLSDQYGVWSVNPPRYVGQIYACPEIPGITAISAKGSYIIPKPYLEAASFRNKGRSYTFEQFDLIFNHPAAVMQDFSVMLKNKSEIFDKKIQSFQKARTKRLDQLGFQDKDLLTSFQIPDCTILNQGEIPQVSMSKTLELSVQAKDDHQLLKKMDIFINNVPVFGSKGINLEEMNRREYTGNIRVELSNGDNKIEVSTVNATGAESFKATTYVTYHEPSPTSELFVIAIGVSDYQAPGKQLAYAAKDALNIAALYRSATGFSQVHTRTLINQEVTKADILALRSWLEQSRVDDQVLLYVSGHGLIDDNYDFYYATHDTDFAHPSEKGILYDEIEGLLDGIPARKKLLLMDACHSGEYDADAPPLTAAQQDSLAQKGVSFKGFRKGDDEGSPTLGLQNSFELMQHLFADLRRGSGATVITSSAGIQVSFEDEEWQNGAFTYAFLYGLKSMKADSNQDGQVTASEIQAFVAEYVPRLTEGLQVPTFRRENLEFDFRVW